MKYILPLFFWISLCSAAHSDEACERWPSWAAPACKHVHQVFTQGNNELYMTGYAWHNRASYTRKRLKKYNEKAFGGGLGKGFYDEKGNWHGLYAFAFQDSHKHIEPIAGYAFLKTIYSNAHIKIGGGLSAFLTARQDMYNNIPFPGILPWVSLTIHRFSLSTTYIPGSKGTGNVLFVFGKWTF